MWVCLQEMIDGFLDPEIYDVIVSTGSTWAVRRTGPTTVIIYQAEPNPQAVQDTIGNEAFGAKFGPIVAKMVCTLLLLSLNASACAWAPLRLISHPLARRRASAPTSSTSARSSQSRSKTSPTGKSSTREISSTCRAVNRFLAC